MYNDFINLQGELFMDELKCPICGEPTYVYYGNPRKDKLCKTHGTMANKGLIEQCPDCEKWHNTDETCECKQTKQPEHKPEKQKDELTCIICGQPSNGKHFCLDCWKKYKNKTLYIQVKNCQDCITMGAEYEGHLETKDGHIVKSHVERDIDNYLFSKNIPHAYESTFDVDGNPEHEFQPDFYLPNYLGENEDVYIEYFGMKGTKDGDRKINYKMPIYREKTVTLICLYPHDDSKIEAVLKRKLNRENIKPHEINWEE